MGKNILARWIYFKLIQCTIYAAITKQNVHESYRSSKFQIKMAFHSLFGDSLGNSFGMSTFKLSGKKVTKPSFQQWGDSSHEEEPYPPSWSPESTSRTLPHWALDRQITSTKEKSYFLYSTYITECFTLH